MASPNQQLIKALLKLLKDSNWHSKSRLLIITEENSLFPAEKTYEYILEGSIFVAEALALRCWTPDQMRDQCEELIDQYKEEVSCLLDFIVQTKNDINVHDIVNGKHVRLFKENQSQLILCWSSYHEDTLSDLETLSRIYPSISNKLQVVGLIMDEDPSQARKIIAKQYPFPNYWVGEDGFSSEVALLLSYDDPAPTAFVFDETGKNVAAGLLQDILIENLQTNGELILDHQFESHENLPKTSKYISHSTWENIKTELQILKHLDLSATLKTTYQFFPSSKTPEKDFLVYQKIIFEGNVFFPEFEREIRKLKNFIPVNEESDWENVQFIKKPKYENPKICTNCSSDKVKYACLLCQKMYLCKACGDVHLPKNHPLAILDLGEISKAIYGIGDVTVSLVDADSFSEELHPDIACNGCLRPITSSIRYRNLAKDDHDLCETCYQRFLRDPTVDFGCELTDPFCEMKDSNGVVFLLNQIKLPVRNRISVPFGHTEFTWSSEYQPSSSVSLFPVGHTAFSWKGNL